MSLNELMKANLLSLVRCTRGYKLLKPFYSGIGHILTFHRVCGKNNGKRLSMCSGLEVRPEYLENVVNFFLSHDYDVISLDQLSHNLQRDKINKKFVIFTFDDGYIDNLTYAYPIFKRYHIPFTIYITTGFPDRSAVLWWYLLEEMILERDFITFEIEGEIFNFHCAAFEEKEKVFLKVLAIIKNSHENNYWGRIQQIFVSNRIDIHKKTEELILDWQQIRELSNDPLVTIGSHTVHHYCLSKLSEAGVRHEILESKRKLESHIDREVRHFAYPFGHRKEAGAREFKLTRECGYQTALTGRSANIFLGHRDHLEALPRITMGESLDNQRLLFLINGLMHCRNNNFKRVVTA